jgi:hypothetical protein
MQSRYQTTLSNGRPSASLAAEPPFRLRLTARRRVCPLLAGTPIDNEPSQTIGFPETRYQQSAASETPTPAPPD